MKLEQLKYFVETARYEHIGKAAEAISISPSAISHSIAALEQEFGRPLFSRQGRRIFLTHHGKLLLARAESLLSDANQLRQEMLADHTELQGRYKLAATHMLNENFLVPAWLNVTTQHQKLSSEILILKSAEVLERVCSGELDFGLCMNPQKQPGFKEIVLYQGAQVLVARKSHPLFRLSEKERVKYLSDYPTISPKYHQGIESCDSSSFHQEQNIEPNIALSCDSYTVMVSALQNSDMWSFMPCILHSHYADKLGILSTEHTSKVPVKISAIWPANHVKSSVIALLLESLQTQIHCAI